MLAFREIRKSYSASGVVWCRFVLPKRDARRNDRDDGEKRGKDSRWRTSTKTHKNAGSAGCGQQLCKFWLSLARKTESVVGMESATAAMSSACRTLVVWTAWRILCSVIRFSILHQQKSEEPHTAFAVLDVTVSAKQNCNSMILDPLHNLEPCPDNLYRTNQTAFRHLARIALAP